MTINHLRRWHAAQHPGGRRRNTETIDKYLEEMRGGEVLCRQHSDGETRYWLTPSQKNRPKGHCRATHLSRRAGADARRALR